jgi:O-antigen/teichoic acid export membrane protein
VDTEPQTTQAVIAPVPSPTILGRLRGSAAARDGIYVLAAQGLAALIALGAESLLFRNLEKTERGILSAAFGLRTVLLYIADMGMTLATIRVGSYFVAKGMLKEANAVFRRALVFRWLAALVVGGIVLLLTPTLAKQLLETPTRPVIVYACIAALLGMTTVSWGLDVAQCRRRMSSYFVQYVGEAILRACAIVIVLRVMEVQTQKLSELILWTMAAGVILAAIVSVLVERDAFADAKGFGLAAPPGVSAELRAFIPYATAATFLGMVSIYVELFLLQHLRKPEETAVFEGARRLASLLPLLTAGLATIMLPRASALETPAECLNYMRKALKLTAPAALLICGALALSASFIVPLLWGK